MSDHPPPIPPAVRRMRGFEPAAGLLRHRIREAGESRGFAVARVLTHWDEIAGPELAAMARPVKITYAARGFGATLVLLVRGAQAPLVEMRKEALRERVNACYGYNAVARVVLTQTSAAGFAEAQAAFHGAPPARPAEADPQARRAAHDLAEGVTDPALRAALEDMGRTILSRPRSGPRSRE